MGLKENLDADYQAIADVLSDSILKGKTIFNKLTDILNYIHKKRLTIIPKFCINCRFFNENWEKEWNQKEHSWCRKPAIDMLNDKESEKLGYCKHFIERIGIRQDKQC